jgi:vitamin-K-epoxide reductase (warfarin-sensitive)
MTGYNRTTEINKIKSSRSLQASFTSSITWDQESSMRWLLIMLAVVGIAASSLALREHYRTDASPCSINERWDCGIVNHSPYAMIYGVPVAVIGIVGYLLLGVLAFKKAYRVMLVAALGGLGFALHLAHIESTVLGVWCIYCAISLGVISLLSLLILGTVIVGSISPSRKTA